MNNTMKNQNDPMKYVGEQLKAERESLQKQSIHTTNVANTIAVIIFGGILLVAFLLASVAL